MTIADYPAVYALWARTEGMCLRDADGREEIARYLERNPGLCVVAEREGIILGAVLCGHDGRRGYLQHLAVERAERGRGIGSALVRACADGLQRAGIRKCHLLVHVDNAAGLRFWEAQRWRTRRDVIFMSATLDAGANA